MTSVFEEQAHRSDPAVPMTQTPLAAQDGGPDDDSGAGFDFSVFFGINASLGSLVDGLQADRDHRDRMRPPGETSLLRSDIVPASGSLTLDLGSVPIGRVWQVRRVNVGGASVTTDAAGRADVFGQGAAPADLNLTNWKWSTLALPFGQTFGTHQLFLTASAHLWVVFSGATVGQQYTASADVEDWEAETFASTFVE
jgi:hypothetical protein